VRILYDGWELAYRPNSPAAIHLLTLLAARPKGIQALVGMPAESIHTIPDGVESHLIAVPDRPESRLLWEQRRLPELGRVLKADLIHSFEGVALLRRGKSAISPATRALLNTGFSHDREPLSLAGRLRDAFGQGGFSRAGGLFWPSDLAELINTQESRLSHTRLPPVYLLPAVVHPAFTQRKEQSNLEVLVGQDIPETFILYHGSGERIAIRRLLAAWSWAAGPIGEYFPLVAVGLDRPQVEGFQEIARQIQVDQNVHCLTSVTLPILAKLYQASSVVFCPQETTPWGSSLRQAIACAKPVVGLETPLNDKILGPAGFLVRDSGYETERNRALGAGLISVIVEEELAQKLTEAARKRSEAYNLIRFSHALGGAYRSLIGDSNK
jgi:glycosyltransferase involved in cell wall biosynthesis